MRSQLSWLVKDLEGLKHRPPETCASFDIDTETLATEFICQALDWIKI